MTSSSSPLLHIPPKINMKTHTSFVGENFAFAS